MIPARHSARRAFTLIELLVVIAIIAILAAILFPVFARAREAARQTACRSNVKQLVTALSMYQQDYDEALPAVNFASPNSYVVPFMLNTYIKNQNLWLCPSDAARSVDFYDSSTANQYTDATVSYGFNLALNGAAAAAVQKPTDTVAFCDFVDPTTQVGYQLVEPYNALTTSNPLTGATPAVPYYRHNNVANVGFLDGHVKSMPGSTTTGSTYTPMSGSNALEYYDTTNAAGEGTNQYVYWNLF